MAYDVISHNERGKDMAQPAKHAPGPWSIDAVRNETEKLSIVDADMCFVADVWQTYVNGKSRQQDNAHLIAAAPTMYEALKMARGLSNECECHESWNAPEGNLCGHCTAALAIKTALSQAEGKQ